MWRQWERGPPDAGGLLSSSTQAEKKKKSNILEKFDKSSKEIKIEKEGSKNLKEDKKIKKKKKEGEVLEKKTKKISENFAFKPNKKVAYLEEGSVKENCALSGTARAARTSSPPSQRAPKASPSTPSEKEQLPPSGIRSSLSPKFMFTNGSTLCAQYRQHTADYFKREEEK
jgi:hypothetical protein